MIVYHPAYDAHHCSYRILNILYAVKDKSLSSEMIRFVDFYYLYPHLLKNMSSLPKPLNYKRKIIQDVDEPFEITPNPMVLFYELGKTQKSVLASLQNKSIISMNNRMIKLNVDSLPGKLIEAFKNDSFTKQDIFQVLIGSLTKVNLHGPNGFKAKSGLMEFRYG